MLDPLAKYIISQVNNDSTPSHLIIITIDQRNHGERLTNELAQKSWGEGNPTHGMDMVAMQDGTRRDISYLIDFLPSYIFVKVAPPQLHWLCSGISLGGHATWLALAHDKRILGGIPIIGCPDMIHLLTRRAERQSIKDKGKPPTVLRMPQVFVDTLKRIDPCHQPLSAYKDKKILILSGKDDGLVVWEASDPFVSKLKTEAKNDTTLEVHVFANTRHEVTQEMVSHMIAWLKRYYITPHGKL